MRRWWLRVPGVSRWHGSPLTADDLGPTDEILCGQCNALLAIDHHARIAGIGAVVGEPAGFIACGVCGARNQAGIASGTDPTPSRTSAGQHERPV